MTISPSITFGYYLSQCQYRSGSWRRGKVIDLKTTADTAMDAAPSVRTCVVLKPRSTCAVRR